METLDVLGARRLALARAGLLKPNWTDLPRRASGSGRRARAGAHAVIQRFGYLQLDTVSIAGARSHGIVLLSRLEGIDAALPEQLLAPGEPLFEYWGHEASWLPLDLYPTFAFRRHDFRAHPWWGDVVGEHPQVTDNLLMRIRNEGPLKSADFEGRGSRGWWDLKIAKKVASHLWSTGILAIRTRKNFQRSYDLAERVIPSDMLNLEEPIDAAIKRLLLLALGGHGWAQTGTLTATWRLRNLRSEVAAALAALTEEGDIQPCDLVLKDGRRVKGWVRPKDLDLAARLRRVRPRADLGVLLSPFDPVLWDRARVGTLFGFDQILEIFKPAPQRRYGYYCLPVLAADRLVARYDFKADRKKGVLNVLSLKFEDNEPAAREAARSALERYAQALGLTPAF